MKKFRIVGLIALLILVAVLTTTALAADTGKSPYVRLTIINESQHSFSITVYGGPSDLKTISVPAYSQGAWVFLRGTYSFSMMACGGATSGKLDLNMYQTIHIPVCGGKAKNFSGKPHHIDVADYIKPIKILIRNRTGEKIGLYIRTMTDHHFLNLEPGEKLNHILFRAEYAYSYVACGKLVTGYYTPMVSPPFDLKCD